METAAVRRSLVAFITVFSSFFLIAATPPPASILGTPVLLVYSFSVNGSDVSKEAGSRLAIAIATQIANLGGVNVKPAPPGVDRQNYLEAARHESADYYIAGYVTPLGDGVSVVEQLVSTQTGIVVYSNTAQVRTYEDASGQGDMLRDALIRHQTRNLGAYAAPPPPTATASPTPAAGSATQTNLGRLFGRRQKRGGAAAPGPSPTPAAKATSVARATPSSAATPPVALPSATPVAVAAGPKRGSDFGILAIGGPADGNRRSFTSAAIRNDLLASHRRAIDAGATREAACSESHIGTLLGGNLSTNRHTILGQLQTTATLEFFAYDCAGNIVYQQTFAHDVRGDWQGAVNGVVARAVAAFLRAPGTSPHG